MDIEEPKGLELDVYSDPHNGYPIIQMDCSPNIKYVATLSEFDKSVALWSIDPNQQSLQYESMISIENIDVGSETSTTFTVSDDGYVAIKLRRLNPRNFEIYNFKTAEISFLQLPYLHKNISHLSFINNGNLVMASIKDHKAYVLFPEKTDDNIKWIFQSLIELKNSSTSDDIYITPKGKLIFFKKATYEFTIWDLKTLSIEARILLDWCFNFECIGFSDDEELIGISASSSKLTYLYIFSTTNGINLSTRTYEKLDEKLVMIDGIHFIASNIGERILIISHVHESLERTKIDLNVHRFHDEKRTFDYELMDPYTLTNPVSAGKLFKGLQIKIKPPYIIKSDRIIYVNDEQLFIEKLVKDNWINYLRNDLKDYNKISTPPGREDIINFIKDVESEKTFQGRMEYKGSLINWILYCKGITFALEVSTNKSETFEERKKAMMYVRDCKVLKNDDLVMITSKCVILWTFNPSKGISVHYIWGVGRDVVGGGILDEYWEEIFNNSLAERFLPQSDFDEIIKKANKPDKDNTNLYSLLLGNYIEEKFFLAYYGKILMEKFLILNIDWLVEKLCKSCITKCLDDNKGVYDFQSNIQSLSIIALFYSELIQKNPAIIYKFLSQMAFVVPSVENDDIYYNTLSSSPHLHHYGSYYNLYEIFHFNAFFIISKYWHIFKNNNKPLFSFIQNHFIKPFTNCYRAHYIHNATIKLLFPLPYFVNYPKDINALKELWRPEPSSFIKSNDLELYKTWNGEALLNFKWNTYGRFYYLFIWMIYTVFLCCFTGVATLSNDISLTHQQTLLIFSIILGIWHFIFELRQFIYSPILYITSPWNFVDLGAFLFPTITSIIMFNNYTVPNWAIIFSTLLLELKFLTYFRSIEYVGVYFAMIIGVAKRGFLFIIILAFIVFAFAHSLHLLLRPTTNISLDQPSFSNDPNDPWNLTTKYYTVNPDGSVSKNPFLIEPPNASTNMFSTLMSAILAVYIMLTGDSTSLSPWALNEDITLTILVVVFSFFTTIYLMNLFIGLLGGAIDETNNKEYFLLQRAEVLTEIELFYMLPYQRRKYNWFPSMFFYEVHVHKLRDLIRDIQNGKWATLEKPYTSPLLLKVIHIEAESEISQIKKSLEDLTSSFDEFKKEAITKLDGYKEVITKLEQINHSYTL